MNERMKRGNWDSTDKAAEGRRLARHIDDDIILARWITWSRVKLPKASSWQETWTCDLYRLSRRSVLRVGHLDWIGKPNKSVGGNVWRRSGRVQLQQNGTLLRLIDYLLPYWPSTDAEQCFASKIAAYEVRC